MAFFNEILDNEINAPAYKTNDVIIFNADCLDVLKTIKNESIDLVVTDPPYRIKRWWSDGLTRNGKKYMGGVLSHLTGNNKENARSGKLFDYNDIKFEDWIPEIFRILKYQSHCYIFTNGSNIPKIWNIAENCGFKYQQLIVWSKR